ncbi:RNA polymerase subunit sigma [Phyllobacterium brassicacearum]|uniref:RNA polymerase subunit sigma n=1 Tax=Phyllobacterium brassicacearum TaxID=314235 RepID=A0A2P7BP07_9HYPH|nr:sigma-70 family RNA polymerase sigma factor [Phyllobacterium brassicacearum]PSH68201.1 RNA polymerase subunit sigma [Phyllobacterium brassicacearum]TDQ29560.1 RNA polymerase sigma-70 factor (ECF subfamily) [Phyllobacterium brassicacearum]
MEKEQNSCNGNVLVNALIQYKPKLIKIAENVLHSHAQSEDIFHDAIIKACTMRSDCIQCPVGYACRMVYNLALDEARKQSHERHHRMPIDGVESIPAPSVSALDCMVTTETLREVLNSLKSLPKRTHDAFVRHRIDGVPQKDIAEELGVSRTLVNFMIKDAHRACQRTLNAA